MDEKVAADRLSAESISGIDVNEEIGKLVERWCDRREYGALATVLPAWICNNGLTDGWGLIRDALRHVYAASGLPQDEKERLKTVYVTIDTAIRNR